MKKTIKGKRILLRHIDINDSKSLVNYLKEPKLKKLIGLPTTIIKMQKYIKNLYAQKTPIKSIRRVIVLLKTKETIGSIAIKNISKKNKKADLGYWIGGNYEGQGLMTESLQILLSYLFEVYKMERIQSRIKIDNISSQRLAEKLGFMREGLARNFAKKEGKYYDFFLYGLLKEDFKLKH